MDVILGRTLALVGSARWSDALDRAHVDAGRVFVAAWTVVVAWLALGRRRRPPSAHALAVAPAPPVSRAGRAVEPLARIGGILGLGRRGSRGAR